MMYPSQFDFEHLNLNFVNGQQNICSTSNYEMDNHNRNYSNYYNYQQQSSSWSSAPAVTNDSCVCITSVAPKSEKRVRTVFTVIQLDLLQKEFAKSKYIKPTRRTELANELSLDELKLMLWFVNRRRKEIQAKKDRLPLQSYGNSCVDINSARKSVRTDFTAIQVDILKTEFDKCKYIKGRRRTELANKLNLSELQIRNYFQNRRQTNNKKEINDLNMKLSYTASVSPKSDDFNSGKCVETGSPLQYYDNSYESYPRNYENSHSNNQIPYNNNYYDCNINNNYVAPIGLTTTHPEAQAGQQVGRSLNDNNYDQGASYNSTNHDMNNEMPSWVYEFISKW